MQSKASMLTDGEKLWKRKLISYISEAPGFSNVSLRVAKLSAPGGPSSSRLVPVALSFASKPVLSHKASHRYRELTLMTHSHPPSAKMFSTSSFTSLSHLDGTDVKMMSPLHSSMQNWLKRSTCVNHKDSMMVLTIYAS